MKKHFLSVFLCLLALILGGIGFFYFKKDSYSYLGQAKRESKSDLQKADRSPFGGARNPEGSNEGTNKASSESLLPGKGLDQSQGLRVVKGEWGDRPIEWLPTGVSPMRFLKAHERVPIRFDYGVEGAGREVIVQAEDGGTVSGKTVLTQKVSPEGIVEFVFQPTENIGLYRVTVRGGGSSRKSLQFWVGDQPPLRKS